MNDSLTPQNFQGHFRDLAQFLKDYQWVFNQEIIHEYPKSLGLYPDEWRIDLELVSESEQWQFDAFGNCKAFKESSGLSKLIQKLNSLCYAPKEQGPDNLDLPSWAFHKVSQKKRHEIAKISETLNREYKKRQLNQIIDIGGGVGHLSRVMAKYFNIPMLSIDANKEFQEVGKKKFIHHPSPADAASVNFHHLTFGHKSSKENELFKRTNASVGLHTCGPLAIEHIVAFDQSKSPFMLNFGCCYNIMNPQKDLWLSQFAKENCSFTLNKFSLTLATRGHSDFDLAEYQLKKKVKFYRYALHLYLYEYFGHAEFITAGSVHPREYLGSFDQYALGRLKAQAISPLPTPEELNSFFKRLDIQKSLSKMFLWNLVRWQFGRPIEYMILLDRCLWLTERGHQVKLSLFFNQGLSPRNLGIFAKKKSD